MSHLPILVPGRTEPVLVPCRLPESITFCAFLPSRGVREFTLWLTSTDPLNAEVSDVQPTNREGDPRGPDGWALDSDEQRHADDAAADVLDGLLARLNLGPDRNPRHGDSRDLLPVIALAWRAEVEAFAAQAWVIGAFRHAGHERYADDCARFGTDINSRAGWDKSPTCEALRCYVDLVTDEACSKQADKADKQAAEWQPPSHPEDVNPPAWAERHEVTP